MLTLFILIRNIMQNRKHHQVSQIFIYFQDSLRRFKYRNVYIAALHNVASLQKAISVEFKEHLYPFNCLPKLVSVTVIKLEKNQVGQERVSFLVTVQSAKPKQEPGGRN